MMHLSNRANQLQESAIRKLNSTVVQQKMTDFTNSTLVNRM